MLPIPVVAIAGILIGWLSWLVAATMTPDPRPGPAAGTRAGSGLALASCIVGGGVITSIAIRSGEEITATITTAILAVPLLVTLLTDVRGRVVFPAVLAPGLVLALVLAAMGPGSLPAALLSGAGAGLAAAVLVVLSRWLWSNTAETPLGTGDIMIAATIGTMLGPDRTPPALFAGIMLAAVVAGGLLLTRQVRPDDPMPYGACLCAAALVALAI